MAIRQSEYIDIKNYFIKEDGVRNRDMGGLVFTENKRLPIGSRKKFSNSDDVRDFFGPESDEYLFSQTFYSSRIENTRDAYLTFARFVYEDSSPDYDEDGKMSFSHDIISRTYRIVGDSPTKYLNEFKKIDNLGKETIVIKAQRDYEDFTVDDNGDNVSETKAVEYRIPVVFDSTPDTYDDVASKVQENILLFPDLEGVHFTYEDGRFVLSFDVEFQKTDTGDYNQIDPVMITGIGLEKIESESVSSEGVDYNYADHFGFREGYSEPTLIVEQDAECYYEAITHLTDDYNDFGSFTYLDSSTLDELVAQWVHEKNYKFIYMVEAYKEDDIESIYEKTKNLTGVMVCLDTNNSTDGTFEFPCAMPMAIFASMDFYGENTVTSCKFTDSDFLSAVVTTEDEKKSYDKYNVNYMGLVQENGTIRKFFQEGVMTDGEDFQWFCSEVWLQDYFTTELFKLMLESEKISPTINSLELVSVIMTPPIQYAKKNGMIETASSLDDATKLYINNITNTEDGYKEILKDGFALVLTMEQGDDHGYFVVYDFIYHRAGLIKSIKGSHFYKS